MNIRRITRVLTGGAIAALLAACGASQNPIAVAPPAAAESAPAAGARGGCPTSRCIAVANFASSSESSIIFFARGANGNARPVGKIQGFSTQLAYPTGLAMDSSGELYAANAGSESVTVYAAGAEGNVAPIRTISGAKTQLHEPTGVALDREGRLYVVNYRGNSITVYPAGATGNVRPVRIITGEQTTLVYPWGIALDAKSNIYITNTSSSVNVYAAKAKGDAAPSRVISGQLTQLLGAQGIVVDKSGYTYVANWQGGTVLVFAPGANGNVPPAREETQPYLYSPDGVALDAHGKTYVSDGCADNPNFVAVFAAAANNAPPLRTIEGDKTEMTCATSILVR